VSPNFSEALKSIEGTFRPDVKHLFHVKTASFSCLPTIILPFALEHYPSSPTSCLMHSPCPCRPLCAKRAASCFPAPTCSHPTRLGPSFITRLVSCSLMPGTHDFRSRSCPRALPRLPHPRRVRCCPRRARRPALLRDRPPGQGDIITTSYPTHITSIPLLRAQAASEALLGGPAAVFIVERDHGVTCARDYLCR
jgi:hypothetical protein